MITRIEVDGFKSLRGFVLDLEPFTALVGPNGAGKSNLLDALGLLSRIACGDLATAFREGRGRIREQFSRSGAPVPEHGSGTRGTVKLAVEVLLVKGAIDTAIELDVSLPTTRMRYELTIDLQDRASGIERLVVRCERVTAIDQSSDAWVQRHPLIQPFARYGTGSFFSYGHPPSHLTVDDPSAPEQKYDAVVQYVPVMAFAATRDVQARSPHLRAVAEELRSIRLAHLEPRLLREPSERGAPALTAEGANLPTALASLEPAAAAQVRADLVSLVPGVRTFEVVPDDDMLHVEIEMADGQRFSARELSDGTLRVLGLVTLLRSSPPGTVLAVEEPENGIHPTRIRALVEKLRSVATGGTDGAPLQPQVIATSHSPVVLAALLDHPASIAFFDLVRHGTGLRHTRARAVATVGPPDRERRVSLGEIHRILDVARSAEHEPR